MPKKKSIDNAKLIKMIEEKIPSPEIRKKLNIKTANQLKVAYAVAMMEARRIPEIIDGRKGAASKETNEVTVGKRGSIIIPKGMVESLGVAVGDKFSLRKTKAGIALKKL
ncbi:MAG: AbrB/MazE/SpoVT family DNA-binding domain-containing protein [Desulfobacterales bacterium]